MAMKSRIRDTGIFSTRETTAKETTGNQSDHVTKSFRLTREQAEKLKDYTEAIAPKHLMISEADVIRYMILNFDLDEAKKNFLK